MPSCPGPREIRADPDAVQQLRDVVAHLRKSEIYRSYEDAFQGTTGLPLALRSAGSFHSPLLNATRANPFCRLMSATDKSCAACLSLQQRVEDASQAEAGTLQCFAGLSESAVPIRVGGRVIAFLQTGQVFLRRPSKRRFLGCLRRLQELGAVVDRAEIEKAYFATRVVFKPQYDSILRLLSLIADHLSRLTNQLMLQQVAAELPAVARARAYIVQHQAEDLTLGGVAKAANMSTSYFCKSFHKASGLTFTDYLGRLRIESVKSLLLDPHKRVSEAAYEAGFRSLSQFNRVFRRVESQTPTLYRGRLSAA